MAWYLQKDHNHLYRITIMIIFQGNRDGPACGADNGLEHAHDYHDSKTSHDQELRHYHQERAHGSRHEHHQHSGHPKTDRFVASLCLFECIVLIGLMKNSTATWCVRGDAMCSPTADSFGCVGEYILHLAVGQMETMTLPILRNCLSLHHRCK
eukprot:CAMPEP_0196659806 /NCGR_PEP_ID=MMETSP1086-20130531/36643_1 /TAXON_ID=77921 /ORGANISM="Cyanoptyche  gloeocystis , Strain SAG4.97" /LENGTH=152 /DNA_ID=CAMNT_0041993927 /DNA_START=257 /DNA_END=712 /DNA_ORIENTATION=-